MNSLAAFQQQQPPPPSANAGFGYPPGQPQPQQQQQAGPFYQQQQSFGYGAGAGNDGAASSPMPAGGMLLQGQQPINNYTSTPPQSLPPYQQPIRPSASPPTQQPPQQIQQQLQQHQQRRPSPPNAAPQNPTPPTSTPASTTTKHPMAAPPLPNTPGPMTAASPKTPLSPASESREQQRIAHLLTLNSALLSEISALQSAGQGGVLNPAQAEAARQKGLPDKMASEDYIHTMRRVQANLQYLMQRNQSASSGGGDAAGNSGKHLPGPAIMTAPPHLGERLKAEYERLRELFPEWSGIDGRAAQQAGGGTPGKQQGGWTQQAPRPPPQQQPEQQH